MPEQNARGLDCQTKEQAWTEFMAFIDQNSTANILFRGVSSANYDLTPKIKRKKIDDTYIYEDDRERIIFDNFKRRAFTYLPNINNDWDVLAVAQHYGLPTRLLDWTTNPLIAAWFSCFKDSDCNSKIYAVRLRDENILTRDAYTNIGPFNNHFDEVRFLFPLHTISRISRQGGAFSYHPNNQTGSYIPSLSGNVFTFTVRAEFKQHFLVRLFHFGVDQAFVMADLDGVAMTLEWQARTGIAVNEIINR